MLPGIKLREARINLILLFDDDFTHSRQKVILTGRRHRHVMLVHKVSAGDKLIVGLCNGRIGSGVVSRLDGQSLEMEVDFEADPPEILPVTLLLALPRPPVLKRLLLAVTSMGVKKIFLVNSHRVEKGFWTSHALEEENLREQLILGLEQAKDTVMPSVELRRGFRPFVENELPALIKGSLPLFAHPGSARECPAGLKGPLTLAVGPEGGFIPYEIEKLEAVGFTGVHLGPRILRVETAVPALLARLF